MIGPMNLSDGLSHLSVLAGAIAISTGIEAVVVWNRMVNLL